MHKICVVHYHKAFQTFKLISAAAGAEWLGDCAQVSAVGEGEPGHEQAWRAPGYLCAHWKQSELGALGRVPVSQHSLSCWCQQHEG